MNRNVWLLALSILPVVVRSVQTGDYVDLTFTCPAATICPQICVPSIEDCPSESICGPDSFPCVDEVVDEYSDVVVPNAFCTSPCAPVACGRVIAPIEKCHEEYGQFYDLVSNCTSEVESSGEMEDLSWADGRLVFLFLWFSCGSVAIVWWCWYNQILHPIDGSKQMFQLDHETDSSKSSFQVGYKRTWLGIFLHGVALSIYFGWILLLAITTSLQYSYSDEQNYEIALQWFCLVWNGGFLWSMAMYWPHSIQSLFLRRCQLSEATHVAVFREFINPRNATDAPIGHGYIPQVIFRASAFVTRKIEKLLTLMFTAENARVNPKKGIKKYCRVQQNNDGSKYFCFLFRRYNLDEQQKLFRPGHCHMGGTFAELAPVGVSEIDQLELAYLEAIGEVPDPSLQQKMPNGLNTSEVVKRAREVGANNIEMEPPSFLSSFAKEISKTFYLYQFYIMWIWMTIQYYYMACVNWSIILATGCVIAWFRYRSERVLHALTKTSGTVSVYRNGALVEIDQHNVVPGDVVKIEPGVVHCDMLLLTGEAMADESALTGEATPQPKIPIDSQSTEEYDLVVHKRQSLYAGTNILECEDALAVVIRTASYTTKGELLREIIGLRAHRVDIYKELPIAVCLLAAYSTGFFIYVMFNSSDQPIVAWALGMTAFSNAFPPLLPISFTIPIGISLERLAKQNVACSNTDSILIAGKVDRAFFDKTGTLTNQGLEYISCRSVETWNIGQWNSEDLDLAMSTCHALTRSKAGNVIGNPVDKAMFHQSGAMLVNTSGKNCSVKLPNNTTVQILRRFDFDHNRMTQGVVIRLPDGTLKAILKGSPDRISRLCKVPEKYYDVMESFSRTGMYQIAVAWKNIDNLDQAVHMTRDELEESLVFVGMINFANRLRENTPDVIGTLHNSGVESIMLTGDNLLTGVHVAKESGIVLSGSKVILAELKHDTVIWSTEDGADLTEQTAIEDLLRANDTYLALSGTAWRYLLCRNASIAMKIAPYVRVVGRCLPHDKVSVVDTFIGLGYTTSMCGDGGNDCGALKAAHIGIALSDSDASLVAPFTSMDKDIGSIVTVLREGRCAVASTIATYKYIVMYGNISSYCQLITYKLLTSFSDWMWVFTDGVWTVSFSLTIPLAKPAAMLSKLRPTSSIIGWQTVSSVVGAIFLNYIFMAVALSALFNEDWFACRKWDANIQAGNVLSASDNYETQVTFLMVGYQCIFAAMIFNFGYEFRQAWWKNYMFVLLSTGFLVVHIYITLVPGRVSCFWRANCTNEYVSRGVGSPDPIPLNNSYNTTIMPLRFRVKLLCIALSNGISLVLYEYFAIHGFLRRIAAGFLDNGSKTLTPRLEQAPSIVGGLKKAEAGHDPTLSPEVTV